MRTTLLAITAAVAFALVPGQASAAPPKNDNFLAAETITGSLTNVTGNTNEATMEQYEPWHYPMTPGGHSIWFKWTAPQPGAVEISTSSSSFDTVLSAYTGTSLEGIESTRTQFSGDLDPTGVVGTPGASKIAFPVTAGTTYYIAVDGESPWDTGSVTIHLNLDTTPAAAAADTFANAFAFSTGGGGTTGVFISNALATKEVGEPVHHSFADGHSVWAKWTAPYSGGARFSSCSDRRRHKVLAVYTGSTLASLSKVSSAISDQYPNETCLATTFMAAAQTTYRLVLDGDYGEWGDGWLRIHQDTTPPNTTLTAPANVGPSTQVTFTSTEVNSTFECRTDAQPWTACVTPKSLTGLSHGTHTFQVRAIDELGNVDPTPAQATLNVDAAGPAITLTSGPRTEIPYDHGPSFTWTSDEQATFDCQLDAGPWLSCSSAKTYANTLPGAHVFRVRGKDKWGNVGQPATWSFSSYDPTRRTTGTTPAPTPANPASAPFRAVLAVRAPRKSQALRQKALTFRLMCTAPCTGAVTVRHGRHVLGKARTSATRLMSRSVRIRLGRRAVSRLRGTRGRVRLRVSARATDAAARQSTTSLSMVLR